MTEDFSITTARQGSSYVVAVFGEVDLATAPRLQEALACPAPNVAVDLSAVTFMDSSGMNVIVQACRRVEGDGGTFRVSAASASVRRLFEIACMAEYLHLADELRVHQWN